MATLYTDSNPTVAITCNPVARSSTKARYCALAYTSCEIIWLFNLLKELSFYSDDYPTPTLYTNSNFAVAITRNLVAHQRRNIMKLTYVHTICNCLLQKEFKLDRIDTRLNVVDLFTNLVVGELFHTLTNCNNPHKIGLICNLKIVHNPK